VAKRHDEAEQDVILPSARPTATSEHAAEDAAADPASVEQRLTG
jgi:hypothetical protein